MTSPTTSSTGVDFDITDRANRYEPCPKCGATSGMGLTFKGAPMHLRDELFVRCMCGHTGPCVEVPTIAESNTWPVSVSMRDRMALQRWNDASRAARSAKASSQSQDIPSVQLPGVKLPAQPVKGIVIKTRLVLSATEIEGLVDGRRVILLSNAGTGEWHVVMSASLPIEISLAIQYAKCMGRAFDRARDHGMNIA